MTDHPDFIDNRDGNTLAQALALVFGFDSKGERLTGGNIPKLVRIATAFFSPTGFSQIGDFLKPVPEVRLLLGADPAIGLDIERKQLDESTEGFGLRRMRIGLRRMHDLLKRERDNIPFSRTTTLALHKLVDALRSGNIEVRRYEKAFLHAKAYVIDGTDESHGSRSGVIVGSSNLTGAGLTQNLELNLGRYDDSVCVRASDWFDDLWSDAVPYELAVVFEEALKSRTPWEIFIRVLWQLYGKEVESDADEDLNLPLTSLQKHGVARAMRLIHELGGAIVADEVGLGKTFIAGEILQFYTQRRQRALLICPAALRDSTWKRFLTTYQLFVECLSYEQLANDAQLRDQQRPHADKTHIQRSLEEYQLVIVDEAHNYRNPDTPTRAAALRKLMFGRKRNLLLLTATPVNNSLWDLYHLLRFFLRQDAHLASHGVLSIKQRFDLAMREDPSNLSPDVLYPVIDATTVKRTRQFVKKHYANDTISDEDGIPRPIVFPQPNAISVRYILDDLLPGFFDKLENALDPDGSDALSFVRYTPDVYLVEEKQEHEEDARENAVRGLLRSGLLKRFESSVYAFRQTVQKMVHEHHIFLNALDSGRVVFTAFMKELSANDESIFEDVLDGTTHSADASLYNVKELRQDVERDRDLLQALADEAAIISPDRDPKLKALADAIVEIAKQAERESIDSNDARQKRKVLVFSYFEDTVVWIQDFLENEISKRSELQHYKNRMEVVSGSDELSEVSRQKAILGFAPLTMGSPGRNEVDLYDILISTDVLAEGVNLQQCRNIVNFDVPWNPMRLVQRHGRIDRIGSQHNRVFLRTVFPVDRLDQLLNLEQRILDKLAMAAASVGVEAPIEGAAHGKQVFTETREEIEKLLAQDSSLYERGGTFSAAQTGEEYRQTLRKALQTDLGSIANLPWKVGSAMVSGTRRGVFFCAVVGNGSEFERTYLRFVSANSDWEPEDGDEFVERELGTCLRLIECDADTPIWNTGLLQDRVYDFWQTAKDDILREWMRETDPANLQPSVRPLNIRVAEFIRRNTPSNVPQERLDTALDILESPWPRREEVMLRGWFEDSDQTSTNLSEFLINQIMKTGLEAAVPPQPLPPIGQEEIELLCWMGIESADAEA